MSRGVSFKTFKSHGLDTQTQQPCFTRRSNSQQVSFQKFVIDFKDIKIYFLVLITFSETNSLLTYTRYQPNLSRQKRLKTFGGTSEIDCILFYTTRSHRFVETDPHMTYQLGPCRDVITSTGIVIFQMCLEKYDVLLNVGRLEDLNSIHI